LTQLVQGTSVCDFVLSKYGYTAALAETYNRYITLIERFRRWYLQYAANYGHQQSQSTDAKPTAIGTGGTPFMLYLDEHKRETTKFLVRTD